MIAGYRVNPHPLTVNWSPNQDGFRPHCGCGWTGGLHAYVSAASDEGREHATGAAS